MAIFSAGGRLIIRTPDNRSTHGFGDSIKPNCDGGAEPAGFGSEWSVLWNPEVFSY